MALSGTINSSAHGGRYLQFAWTATQSIENNSTTINWTLKGAGTADRDYYYADFIQVSVDGQPSNYNNKIKLYNGTIVGSGTKILYHHATTGARTFRVQFSASLGSTIFVTPNSISGSADIVLDTIPKITTPTASKTYVFMNGDPITIGINGNMEGLTHELSYSFGSLTNQTAGLSASTGVTDSVTFTPPISLADQIPNSTSGRATIFCETYYGSTLIGIKSINVTIYVYSSDVEPRITHFSVAEGNTAVSSRFFEYLPLTEEPSDWSANYANYYSRSGAGTTANPYTYTALPAASAFAANTYYQKINYFIQNQSKFVIAISADGASGSTIRSYQTTVLGKTYTGTSFTTDTITGSREVDIKIRVSDSRGLNTEIIYTVYVEPYSAPSIGYFNVYRINTQNQQTNDGERIRVLWRYSILPLHNLNEHTFDISYSRSNENSFSTFYSASADYSMFDVTGQSFLSSPVISSDYTYIVRLSVHDSFSTTTYDFEVPTGAVIIDFNSSGKGMAFGKVSESNAMEINMPIHAYENLTFEPGKRIIQEDVIFPTLNSGWSQLNGSEVSYWKDKNGIVHLSGVAYGGNFSTELNYCIFQLPSGYQPAKSEYFSVVTGSTDVPFLREDTNHPYKPFTILIQTSGRVTSPDSQTRSFSGRWVSLSGISFRAN